MEMSKIILTVEQDRALTNWRKHESDERTLQIHVVKGWGSEQNHSLNNLSNVEIAQALINGWKVEQETTATKIDRWIRDRNIHTGEPTGQMLKLAEEMGELAGAIVRKDVDGIEDGIGDMGVVLRSLCLQLELNFESCLELAYNEIKDRKGKLVNGVFVKEEDLKGGESN